MGRFWDGTSSDVVAAVIQESSEKTSLFAVEDLIAPLKILCLIDSTREENEIGYDNAKDEDAIRYVECCEGICRAGGSSCSACMVWNVVEGRTRKIAWAIVLCACERREQN